MSVLKVDTRYLNNYRNYITFRPTSYICHLKYLKGTANVIKFRKNNVIPAEAGIQQLLPLKHTYYLSSWAPAFAGVTEKMGF